MKNLKKNNGSRSNVAAPLASLSSMDLTQPIDIQEVMGAVAEHGDLLVPLDMLDAAEVLRYASAYPGVTNSLTLGRVTNGAVSSQYNGVFIGRTAAGKVVPRTLTVYPIKIEEADEPERYRRSYITEVRGGLWEAQHPFAVWLVRHVIALASKDLLEVLFTAKYDANISVDTNRPINVCFDGWATITEDEKTAGNIAVAKGNMFETGELTAQNIGDKLLAMWRSRPETFRRKKSQLWLSPDLFDLYTDWYETKFTYVAGIGDEEPHPVFLRGTDGKVELRKAYGLPAGSQWTLLTTRENMIYGFDNEDDMRRVQPFNSGNPYWFTMAGKYVFGTQFISIDGSEFCINDQPLTPNP